MVHLRYKKLQRSETLVKKTPPPTKKLQRRDTQNTIAFVSPFGAILFYS
jgi:hypothetical protein